MFRNINNLLFDNSRILSKHCQ